jgi:fermentation-respiration switch protein FrsA (DUF1100 family)
MTQPPAENYRVLDRPEVLAVLFHPRSEYRHARSGSARDVLIPVEDRISIGGRFHMTAASGVNILFFHGNGEIVSDYDELGPQYNRFGINFLPVDYRGYGRSGGTPSVSSMMADGHRVFDFVRSWLEKEGYTGPLVLMGRSIGSAPALELAAARKDEVDALIVESGFAYAGPLLQLMGINLMAIDFREKTGFGNLDKIGVFDKPCLIIHAEYDHIIPFADGQALYDRCPSAEKNLLKIPGANHNDIFARGMAAYLAAVRELAGTLTGND